MNVLLRSDLPIVQLVANTPKQSNGNDCGVYVVLYSETIIFQIVSKEPMRVVDCNWNEFSSEFDLIITEKTSDAFRRSIHDEIKEIANKKLWK